jgi:acyl-coenzyme A thioesterase PaaI-like protein
MTLGTYSSSILAPAALPLPFSPEDLHHTNTLRQTMHALPLAVRLANDPNWESWDAYTSLPPESLPHRLTTGPMGGMRGIGYQHVFANRETGEFVVLVWLGKGLAGWPGVVHGGCIATVLDECLGRPALRWFDERSGVTARLEIQYKKPVLSGGWWLVRSKVEEDAEGSGEKRNKTWVNGTLEDLDGNVYVGARALYVVPKTIKLKSMGKF